MRYIQGSRYLSISPLIKCPRSFHSLFALERPSSWPFAKFSPLPGYSRPPWSLSPLRSRPLSPLSRFQVCIPGSFEGLDARRPCNINSHPLSPTALANPTLRPSTGLFARQTNGDGLFDPNTIPSMCKDSCTSAENSVNVRINSLIAAYR